MSSSAPLCANCGNAYWRHKWRSDKGACMAPPPGKKTYYRVPDKVEPAPPRRSA